MEAAAARTTAEKTRRMTRKEREKGGSASSATAKSILQGIAKFAKIELLKVDRSDCPRATAKDAA